jgi:Phosphotransferase enzyme family
MNVTRAVPDGELIDELGGELDGQPIVGLRRAPYRYATSAPLEAVRVVVEGGEEAALILKDLSRDRLPANALAAKPEFLHQPRRELDVYRRILGPAGVGPRCFAAHADPDGSHDWLLLEKVPGVELWQVGELDVWERVAHWLGDFHAAFAGRLDQLRAVNAHLLVHDAAWFRSWYERAMTAIAGSRDRRGADLAAALGSYDAVIGALAELPRTLVHGEFYPSNVLVVRDQQPVGVYPVDWEMAAIGPGTLDLAALAGGWGASERQSLARAYLEGLGSDRPIDELLADLSRCRLHLALQWLGWSSDWLPPDEHAHDWFGEALAAAGELGLR